MKFRRLLPEECPKAGDVCIPVSILERTRYPQIPQDPEQAAQMPIAVLKSTLGYRQARYYLGWEVYRRCSTEKSIHANPLPLP